jgi:hypothetical protein
MVLLLIDMNALREIYLGLLLVLQLKSNAPFMNNVRSAVSDEYRFVLFSIFFSVHPLADIRRTVFKLHPLPLATP